MAQELKPIDEIRGTLTKMESELKSALPSYITPEKFKQVVVTALQLNPTLLTLDRASLYTACLNCASDGLLPNGREAALVPFKGTIKYMPMVGGILKLIRNSGELSTVDAITVHDKDQYEAYNDEHGAHFKHVKARGDRGLPILTYGYARTKDGAFYFEEITEEEIKIIAKKGNEKFSAWQGDFIDEMRRKTVLKRLAKRLPKSTDLERAIDHDNEMYEVEVPVSEPPTTSSKLAEAVAPAQAEEAVVKPVSTPIPEPQEQPYSYTDSNGKLIAKGLIEKLDIKHSPDGSAKKWTKFSCLLNDKWYSTFSETLYKKVTEFADKRVLVNLEYKTKVVGENTYYEIVDCKAQVAGVDVEVPI
jgi:recombination protein RecT